MLPIYSLFPTTTPSLPLYTIPLLRDFFAKYNWKRGGGAIGELLLIISSVGPPLERKKKFPEMIQQEPAAGSVRMMSKNSYRFPHPDKKELGYCASWEPQSIGMIESGGESYQWIIYDCSERMEFRTVIKPIGVTSVSIGGLLPAPSHLQHAATRRPETRFFQLRNVCSLTLKILFFSFLSLLFLYSFFPLLLTFIRPTGALKFGRD